MAYVKYFIQFYVFFKQKIPCSTYKVYWNTNHQQMHKESFIINCNTLLHVSTPLGHLQGEFSLPLHWGCTLQLSENVLLTVYWRRELSAVRPDRGEFTLPKTTQYTVNSAFSLKNKVQP
jgi:hypothetical protein